MIMIVIVMRTLIPTIYFRNNYDIPVLIYLPKKFPYDAPDVYIEKSSHLSLIEFLFLVKNCFYQIVIIKLIQLSFLSLTFFQLKQS